MRTLKEYPGRVEAEIAKGFLVNQGIEAFVSGDDEGGYNPAMSTTFGVKVSVMDSDYEKAQAILAEVEKASES